MILDTNFLIAIEKNKPTAIRKARDIERQGIPRKVPEVVIYRNSRRNPPTSVVG
jgi:predicted nucleic acid-binding protein